MKGMQQKKKKGGRKKKTSDVQCNCSPPADRCPVSSRAAIRAALASSPLFIYWA